MEENKIKIYIKVGENNVVKDINSSIFLNNTENYICIDEGFGDHYSHAQNYYLEKQIFDSKGRCNYKYIDNKIVELTEEEKELLFPVEQPQPTKEEILTKEVAILKINDMKKDAIINNSIKTIADLKLEIMNMKGGN